MKSNSSYRYDGRVVIVTGAGGGLGRIYALYFAERGASVVVNDLGTVQVANNKLYAADQVVQEIREKGGRAVANYDSVEFGENIVATALRAFGRIDIIINNAGVLRDHGFSSMSHDEWELVHRVHVYGAFKVTKAAWEIMRKQKFGRIIMISSTAGIYGNLGQANYGSAKNALVGFSNSLAAEGAKYNITCNVVAPLAASKMTENVMPPEALKALKPEFVVPIIGYLTHESITENGGVYEAAAGYFGKVRWQRSQGVIFPSDGSCTPSHVAASWNQVNDFTYSDFPNATSDSDFLKIITTAQKLPSAPPLAPLRFDGKVAVVTGAGGGLGKSHALTLARYGAFVVVNDISMTSTPNGVTTRAADSVVEEIRRQGGTAIANYNSVEEGEKIIEDAIKNFGRIDILINNAGVIRDSSFLKLTEKNWNFVYGVHVYGAYRCARAAWNYMKQQRSGVIINTASYVGLHGNFGQTNYAAAKAALVGLSNVLALEGKKYNIRVNTIAPFAGTPMTAHLFPKEVFEGSRPELISPVVAYLCHNSCSDNGKLFEIGCGWVAQIRRERSSGVYLPFNDISPERLNTQWHKVADFSTADVITSSATSATLILKRLTAASQTSSSQKHTSLTRQEVNSIKNRTFPSSNLKYSERDVILYALGVGSSRKDLNLTYEGHEKFGVLPTFGVLAAFFSNISLSQIIPNFNPMSLLHGEEYFELKRPFTTSGNLTVNSHVLDVIDKGSNCLLVQAITTCDESGEVISYTESTAVIRGIGGFGNSNPVPRNADAVAANTPPSSQPQYIERYQTTENQALLYRLSGDYNPLHSDPKMAAIAGFNQPILHGLCTLGIAARIIFQRLLPNAEYSAFKSVKARFTQPVYPGETLEVRLWADPSDPLKIIFNVRVVERDVLAISNAAVKFNRPVSIPLPKAHL